MNLLSILLTSIGLSIDCFVVCVTIGSIQKNIQLQQIIKISIIMGLFHILMPLIGWYIGASFIDLIRAVDHWIAFGLLFIVGSKIIIESFSSKENNTKFNITKFIILFGLALATSIDALIIGIGFGLIEINILLTCIIIGITALIFSISGIYFGKIIGTKYNKKIEIIGGVVLIAIGIKILFEHL